MTPRKKIYSALFTLGFAFASAFMLEGCKDDEVKDLSDQDEVSVISNATIADNSVDEEVTNADEIIAATAGGRKSTECPTVTRNESDHTIVIDFGTECVGSRGRTRSGKVIVTYTGTFGDGMANRVVTFENFFVNNRQIEGTIYLRNFNRNDAGHLTAERELEDYKVTFENGGYYIINGTTIRELLEGEDDVPGNEVWSVTGSYDGIASNGVEFTRTITTPIIANISCWASGGFLRTKGVLEMTITNSVRTRTRVVDYGDGTCDNTVTVTVNGKTYTITVEG